MDHFNVTVEKDGNLTTTRRGLRVQKQKHKGTSFVHSSAPQDDFPPSPPSKKKSSSSSSFKTGSAEKKYKFVTKDDETSRGSSSRRSKTTRSYPDEEEDDNEDEYYEEDARRSSHRRRKTAGVATATTLSPPPMSSYSGAGMGEADLPYTTGTEMAGAVGYPPQQQPAYEDFSYYPGTTAEMTYPVTTAWPDMSTVGVGVGGGGQGELYPPYFDMGPQEGYGENPPQYQDMYFSGYDASGQPRYSGHGGGAGGGYH